MTVLGQQSLHDVVSPDSHLTQVAQTPTSPEVAAAMKDIRQRRRMDRRRKTQAPTARDGWSTFGAGPIAASPPRAFAATLRGLTANPPVHLVVPTIPAANDPVRRGGRSRKNDPAS